MAQISDRAILPEDTFNMLREKGKDVNEFTIKVMRRAHAGAVPELAATLSGATVEHFTSPELWLPSLCGGGNFVMQGYHVSDQSRPVGGWLNFKVSEEPKEVDHGLLKRAEWRGPPVLEYPPKKETPHREGGSIYELRPPPAPASGDNATRSHQTWSRPAGGGVREVEYGGGENPWQERQRLQGALEQEKRKLEEERLAIERQKHRDELESLKKSHEADMRSFKAEIMSELKSKPTGPDPTVSMLETMLKLQAETARAAEVRAAEDRRAAEVARQASDERFNRLLEKMSDRPKEDPLAIIEKVTTLLGKGNNNEAQMKMMHSMTEMMGSQMNVAMEFVQAAADLQLGGGEKESPVVKAIEAGLKGVGGMLRGAQKRPPQPFVQPQLPPSYEQQARAGQNPQQPPPPPQPSQPVPSAIEQIEGAIRRKVPVAEVAAALITHYQDPSIQQAILESGFDMEKAIQTRLGNWHLEHPDNQAYISSLYAEVEKRMEAAGLFADDGESDDEGTDGDENQE